jgi:hypothetical protein
MERSFGMVYEMRTYTLKPIRLAQWLALYKAEALSVQQSIWAS